MNLPRLRREEGGAVGAILFLATLICVTQVARAQIGAALPLTGDAWSPQSLQQIGLVGALMTAVVVLWRTLQAERTASVVAIKTMTEALAHSWSANAELRRIIEESVAAKRELAEEIKLLRVTLGRMPCTVRDRHDESTAG